MQMAYRGSQSAVVVDSIGVTAKRGEPVDIADPHVRKMLHLQGWEYVHSVKQSDTNTKDGDDS